MKQRRLSLAVIPAAVLLIAYIYSVEAFTDYPKLCPRANVTVLARNSSRVLVNPDKCYPTQLVNRTDLQGKPGIKIKTERPDSHHMYTVLMMEVKKHNVNWMETNFSLSTFHDLVASAHRDVRKIKEYIPPMLQKDVNITVNMTYVILVYRQTPNKPILPLKIPFNLSSWASNSSLRLVGGVEFIIKPQMPTPTGHNQPGVPSQQQPVIFKPQASNNTFYGRNFTNTTYSNHPAYPPNQFYPPSSQSHYPNQSNPPAGQWHPPNQFYPPTSTGKHKKGAAADLQATSYLISFLTLITIIYNY